MGPSAGETRGRTRCVGLPRGRRLGPTTLSRQQILSTDYRTTDPSGGNDMSRTAQASSENRWESHSGGHIVVGVDESESSRPALAWAAAEARTCDVPLHVIYGWSGIGVKIARESGWAEPV